MLNELVLTKLFVDVVGWRAEAIAFVSGECKAGKSVAELCEAGDKLIMEKLAKVYKGKKVEKGLAFPTCVSLNNCCGHFSPLKEDSVDLKDGDVCKMCVSPYSVPCLRSVRGWAALEKLLAGTCWQIQNSRSGCCPAVVPKLTCFLMRVCVCTCIVPVQRPGRARGWLCRACRHDGGCRHWARDWPRRRRYRGLQVCL